MTVPSFRRGVKFRFDTVRDCWIILAPEKLFMPDEIAVEILRELHDLPDPGDERVAAVGRLDAARGADEQLAARFALHRLDAA